MFDWLWRKLGCLEMTGYNAEGVVTQHSFGKTTIRRYFEHVFCKCSWDCGWCYSEACLRNIKDHE